MLFAAISAPVGGAVIGAVIGLFGIVAGLLINGDRAERQRRRDLHARALAAVVDYGEMPFMIFRRRSELEQRSAERIRLSDHFSKVKAEISTCQVLLAADGHPQVADAYEELVFTARTVVGKEAHDAWRQEPISEDSEMNMGVLFERLAPYRSQLATFQGELAHATLPRRQRVARRIRELR
ncbi:MAG TPA: hypothetical protein VFP21_08530 [Solirubrobacterales bacterium]|nr:hypothetical protein [Solirubrobacterales bacterium]